MCRVWPSAVFGVDDGEVHFVRSLAQSALTNARNKKNICKIRRRVLIYIAADGIVDTVFSKLLYEGC